MKKRTKRFLLLVIFVAILSFISYGFTYAKYASNSLWNYYLSSKGFYFSSEELSEEGEKYVNTIWDGEKVSFSIKNNLNDIVITDFDIQYKAICTIKSASNENVSCSLNGSGSNVYHGVLSSFKNCKNQTGDGVNVSNYDKTTCEMNGYDWKSQIASKDLYFDIIGDVSNVDVEITVTSTSPYTKTLSASYSLYKDQSLIGMLNKQYEEHSDYSRLIISNSYKENKCAVVSFDANKVRIEKDENITNYATDTSGYINEITFPIKGKESISFIFYKVTDENYDETLFTLNEIDCSF